MRTLTDNPPTGLNNRNLFRRWLIAVLVPLIVSGVLLYSGIENPARAEGGRVVMLGFDGMDYDLTRLYLEAGDLPNLQKIADQGVFSALETSNPAESPVAWSVMVTGTNPGKTGVFDFLRRNPETYFPELNMTDIVEPPQFIFDTVPVKPAVLENGRKGPAFWDFAGEAGVRTFGISIPMNMPPSRTPCCSIYNGLGVPDIRRTMGTYIYYVTDRDVARERTGSVEGTEMGGRVIEVVPTEDPNTYTTILPGSYYPATLEAEGEITADVTFKVNPEERTVDFTIVNKTPFRFLIFFGGAILSLVVMLCLWLILGLLFKSAKRGFGLSFTIFIIALVILGFASRPTVKEYVETVNEREWSDWVPVKYLMTDWVGLEGFFKLRLIETEPEFQCYVTPVNIDPRGTMVDISAPGDYAGKLLNKYGYFKTYGWDSETWALNENVIDDDVYIADLLENFETKADMAISEMKANDWELFASVFFVTDHIQHMFYRAIDPGHPMYSPEVAEKYGEVIRQMFIRADEVVGRVMDEVLEEGDELIVISDHGFNSFRYSVNLNRWLVDNGYLAEKRSPLGEIFGGEDSSVYELFKQNSEFFQWVDWSRSRAYALGLGQIYLNLEGREAQGIVTENEKDALIDEIIEELKNLEDPRTGAKMMVDVYRADEIYHGDNMEYAPDIVVGFADYYRVSWQTTLGVAAEDLLEDNMRKWSGDHCSFDPSITRAILFSTVPVTVDDPALMDITPSMLSLLGVEVPSRVDGRVIF